MPSNQPQDKMAEKKKITDQVQRFKDDAHAGIDVALLKVDEWRYVPAKFFLNRSMEQMFIEEVDGSGHEHFVAEEVQGVYNFWEANNIWHEMEKQVAPQDRSRAIVVICSEETGP